jgi:hypothetical protein
MIHSIPSSIMTTTATATTAASTLSLHSVLQTECMHQPSRSSFSINTDGKESLLKSHKTKTQRRVRFSEARVVGTVLHYSDLLVEQANQIWWQPNELDYFKTEARTLCRQLRQQQKQQQSFEIPLPRGLEQRICCQRQRHRYLAIRCVLKAQQRSRSDDFIAMVSHKCTQWASDIARLEGQADYCSEYHPHLLASLPRVSDIPMPALPFHQRRSHQQACQKRSFCNDCSSDDSDNDSVEVQRNVRARTA